MILFRNGVLADIMKVSISVGPKSNENDLPRDKRGHTETPGKRSREDRDKGWHEAATNQGTPADKGSFPIYSLCKEYGPVGNSISDFWLLDFYKINKYVSS